MSEPVRCAAEVPVKFDEWQVVERTKEGSHPVCDQPIRQREDGSWECSAGHVTPPEEAE